MMWQRKQVKPNVALAKSTLARGNNKNLPLPKDASAGLRRLCEAKPTFLATNVLALYQVSQFSRKVQNSTYNGYSERQLAQKPGSKESEFSKGPTFWIYSYQQPTYICF
jgi:hypothetical protein